MKTFPTSLTATLAATQKEPRGLIRFYHVQSLLGYDFSMDFATGAVVAATQTYALVADFPTGNTQSVQLEQGRSTVGTFRIQFLDKDGLMSKFMGNPGAGLSANINHTTTTIAASITGGLVAAYPPRGKLQVGSERIAYATLTDSQFTAVTRGVDGTSAASQTAPSSVQNGDQIRPNQGVQIFIGDSSVDFSQYASLAIMQVFERSQPQPGVYEIAVQDLQRQLRRFAWLDAAPDTSSATNTLTRQGNPLSLLLQAWTTTSGGGNGNYDVGDGRGVGIPTAYIAVTSIEALRDTQFPNDLYTYLIRQPTDVKQWSESMLKTLNCYVFVTQSGQLSVKRMTSSGTAVASLTMDTIIGTPQWIAGDRFIANQISVLYDFGRDSPGVFSTRELFSSNASIAKYGRLTPIVLEAEGVMTNPPVFTGGAVVTTSMDASQVTIPTSFGNGLSEYPLTGRVQIDNEYLNYTFHTGSLFSGVSRGTSGSTAAIHNPNATITYAITPRSGSAIALDRATRFFERFAEPPPSLQLDAHYSQLRLDIGDVVTVTHSHVPNPKTGQLGLNGAVFEITDMRPILNPREGAPRVQLTLLHTGLADIPVAPVSTQSGPGGILGFDPVAPPAPTSFTVTTSYRIATDSTLWGTLVASWTAPAGTLRGYIGQVRVVGTTPYVFYELPNVTSFADDNALTGTAFEAQISAVNRSGVQGAYSIATSFTTPSAPPLSAPLSFTVTTSQRVAVDGTLNGIVVASWSAPANAGVGVAGYTARARRVGDTLFQVYAVGSTTSFVDEHALPNTALEAQIAAIDRSNFTGAYTALTSFTTGVPSLSVPQAFTVATSYRIAVDGTLRGIIAASWSAPAQTGMGLVGYTAKIRRVVDVAFQVYTYPNVTNIVDENALPNTAFEAQLAAFDRAGTVGAYTALTSFTTPGLPSLTAPLNFTVTTTYRIATDGTLLGVVAASWSAPTGVGVGIAGYTANVRRVGDIPFQKYMLPNTTSYVDNDALAGTAFEAQIAAIDQSATTGPYTALTSFTTPGLPSLTAPRSFMAVTAARIAADGTLLGVITASWTAPTAVGVGVAGYTANVRRVGDTPFQRYVLPNTTNYVENDALAGTAFEAQIAAIDQSGTTGPYTALTSFTTPASAVAPSVPNPTIVAAIGGITLGWTQVDTRNLLGYEVWRATNSAMTVNSTNFQTGLHTLFLDGQLDPMTLFYYKIRALTRDGTASAFSALLFLKPGTANSGTIGDGAVITSNVNSQAVTTGKRQLLNSIAVTVSLIIPNSYEFVTFTHNIGLIPSTSTDLPFFAHAVGDPEYRLGATPWFNNNSQTMIMFNNTDTRTIPAFPFTFYYW